MTALVDRASAAYRRAVGTARQTGKRTAMAASRAFWRAPLTGDESIALLGGSVVSEEHHPAVRIPALPAAAGPDADEFAAQTVTYRPQFVWRAEAGEPLGTLAVTRSGTPLVGGRSLLDLDFGSGAGLLDRPGRRGRRVLPLVVAPWSHFWGGYYDFLIFVVAKLCRIEAHLGPIWSEAHVCYPTLGTRFERAFLDKLGIPGHAVVDTRTADRMIGARSLVLANNQDYYQPTPTDLALLRRRLVPPVSGGRRRLYIPRRGHRQVRNEAEILPVVRERGFEVVELTELSLDEQLAAFASAEAVVGPHGAGLTNILWCQPGTKVVEFLSGDYASAAYYYLSHLTGLEHSYLVDRPGRNHWSSMRADLDVDAKALARHLDAILG